MTKNILLVGVGGQGTILASKILTEGLMEAGYDVKMSEIHGMSQRGGSVSSQVRFSDKVQSPVIEKGSSDILVAFEKMEALRWLEYAKPNSICVVNDYEIKPMPVISGKASYSKDIVQELKSHIKVFSIDAFNEATSLGNSRALNMILLGATIRIMELESIDWGNIIKNNVKPSFVELNIKAFERGKNIIDLER